MEQRISGEQLESQIEKVILSLAPIFDVTVEKLAGFRKPTLLVVDSFSSGEKLDNGSSQISNLNGRYHFEDCRFEFSRDNLPVLHTLGHEVSHYFHGELNPTFEVRLKELGLRNLNYWAGREFQEFVAELGGLVYANGQDEHFVQVSRGFIYSREGGLFNVFYDYHSGRGYKRADVAFQRSGGSSLPRLARMSVEEGERIMPREFPISFYEQSILPAFDKIRRKR